MNINEMIEKAKKKIKQLEEAGKYKAEHIEEIKENLKIEIQAAYKENLENNIYLLEKMRNQVIAKHDPAAVLSNPDKPVTSYRMRPEEKYKHLSEEWRNLQIEMDQRRGIFEYDINGNPIGALDESDYISKARRVRPATLIQAETAQLLLDNRKMETEIKAAKTEALERELETLAKTKTGNPDRLNIIAAELRNRGKNDIADMMMDHVEEYHIREPWKNDNDFIAAEKQINKHKTLLSNKDLLFLDDEGDKYITIEDLFTEGKDPGMTDVTRMEAVAVAENN